jgi:hypothetical protein
MRRIESDFEFIETNGLTEPGTPPYNESPDLLPEFTDYKDEGCELIKSCLECPYPRCIEEYPRGRSNRTRGYRDREIIRLHLKKKMAIQKIANHLKINRQTVYNVLKRLKEKNKGTIL